MIRLALSFDRRRFRLLVFNRQKEAPIYPAHNSFADSVGRQIRQDRWPWYALGGTLLGGGFVAIYGVKHCDLGCRDDGGFAYLPYYVGIGALAGAILGALIGFAVDSR